MFLVSPQAPAGAINPKGVIYLSYFERIVAVGQIGANSLGIGTGLVWQSPVTPFYSFRVSLFQFLRLEFVAEVAKGTKDNQVKVALTDGMAISGDILACMASR